MLKAIKELWLGILLIVIISVVLVLSDSSRNKDSKKSFIKIATFQISTRPALDDTIKGSIDALSKRGYIDGKNIKIVKFNAENDMSTGNTIAKEIANSNFKMVLTASTPALQIMANANTLGKVIHVFATVTDPYGAGVGIDEKDHKKHPPHLVGVGTFQPVEDAFRIAKKMYPDLKYVGTPWSSGEQCAEACVKKARIICKELGITLLETQVEGSTAVLEASKSLVAKGAQALWVGGDNAVELAIDVVIKVSKEAGIAMFGNTPEYAEKGALFAVGANYYEVGKIQGELAADVLSGKDTKSISIDNMVPPKLYINEDVIKELKEPWFIPEDLRKSADMIIKNKIGKTNSEKPKIKETAVNQNHNIKIRKGIDEVFKFYLVLFNDSLFYEETQKGIIDGLRNCGLDVDSDYSITIKNAHGDFAILNTLIELANSDNYDIIFTGGTPTLQTAIKKIKNKNIVFTASSDPINAGAGESFSNHISNVTGISTMNDVDKLVKLILRLYPNTKKIGTLFTPSEVNSTSYIEAISQAAQNNDLELITVPINSASDVADASDVLCSKNVDAICQIVDNLTTIGFPALSASAKKNNLPIFTFTSESVTKGYAVISMGRDYYDCALEASELAVRILNGEDPASIPISYARKSTLYINKTLAKELNLDIPEDIYKSATKIVE